MSENCLIARIQATRDRIDGWLADNSPYTRCDQKHLQHGTPEQAYWHLGYQIALDDVLRASQSRSDKGQVDRI